LIPYFNQPSLTIGPFSIYAFGLLVGMGIFVTFLIIRRRAHALGLSEALTERMILWILIAGFLMAHVFDRVAYFPAETLDDPLSLLRIWDGISSFGGFLGAAIGIILFFKHTKIGSARWQYLDLIAYAFPIAWLFGRTGCFVAYDHPGIPTSFFLGQVYSDGIVRHNLGLEEALYTLPVALLFLALGRNKTRPGGFYTGLLCVLYAPVRFFLDFLRIIDEKYFGLTPGQYGSILLLLFGAWILWRSCYRAKPVIS
jgi:phosphatidylglycerol---prolipoprotein diacylglyceryl transferase